MGIIIARSKPVYLVFNIVKMPYFRKCGIHFPVPMTVLPAGALAEIYCEKRAFFRLYCIMGK
jgi:hypothetical protein